MSEIHTSHTTHTIHINDRQQTSIEGVTEVLTFTDREIVMKTTQGNLIIKGKDLIVRNICEDKGIVSIDGLVDGLIYGKAKSGSRNGGANSVKSVNSGKSFAKRLFS